MISTDANEGFEQLTARLVARAEAIGSEWLASRLSGRTISTHRWRRPDHLWPGFGKGQS